MWCIGRPLDFEGIAKNTLNSHSELREDVWWPCEALVRVACNEMHRLPDRVSETFPKLDQSEKIAWTKTLLTMFAAALSKSVKHEQTIQKGLFAAKRKAQPTPSDGDSPSESTGVEVSQNTESEPEVETIVLTPYGKGRLQSSHKKIYKDSDGQDFKQLTMNVIELDCGATLYRPAPGNVGSIHNSPDSQTHQFGKFLLRFAARIALLVDWLTNTLPTLLFTL